MLSIRPILKDSHKSLRKKSKEVIFPLSQSDQETAQYLLDYLRFAHDDDNAKTHNLRPGVGLAAPQIGVNKKMLAIHIPRYDEEGEFIDALELVLINPTVISYSERMAYLIDGEGCLSVDENHPGYVLRRAFITVNAYNFLQQKLEKIKLRGYEAIVLQHELDHLDGILFYDRIDSKEPFKKIEGALEI